MKDGPYHDRDQSPEVGLEECWNAVNPLEQGAETDVYEDDYDRWYYAKVKPSRQP